MQTVVVIIPTFQEVLTNSQLLSLKQCFNVLKKYSIVIVCPENLNTQLYIEESNKNGLTLKIEKFNQKYFEGIRGYNDLLLGSSFFERFNEYEYLLIYQLDAFVFKDELIDWCNKRIDYIGAPWIKETAIGNSEKYLAVGNGGFSLRNISNSLRILRRIEKLRKLRWFWFKSRLQGVLKFELFIHYSKKLWNIKSTDHLKTVLHYDYTNEDEYWSLILANFFDDFKIANASDAINFSLETNAKQLFNQNNCHLPFGCHAWEKYDPEFWKKFIM